MCWYEVNPLVKWVSSSDLSTPALGLRCVRTTSPAGGLNLSSWKNLLKILTRLGDL